MSKERDIEILNEAARWFRKHDNRVFSDDPEGYKDTERFIELLWDYAELLSNSE